VTRALIFLCALSLGAARAAEPPLVVGAALPLTGALAGLAVDYRQGLELWRDEVNSAGGLLGRQVELRILDDASAAANTGPLYERLIEEEKAELLIGPYGTSATLAAAAVSERKRRVLMNAAGAGRAVHRRGPRYVFQVAAPYAAYGRGPVAIAADAGLTKLFIVARDDPASREMAQGAREAAANAGLKAGIELYRPGTADFAPHMEKARAADADAWIAFGEVREAAEMVKSFRRTGYAPALVFLGPAADPRFIRLLGQDAEFATGTAEYHPAWPTRGNDAFVKAYIAKWAVAPGPDAAQAYSAGTVLEEALRRAGEPDQEALRETLGALDMPTVLGRYQVDAANGEQRAAVPAVLQILKGRPRLIWPPAMADGRRELPYPQWSERRELR
jgi:branched-chain amino acid transport system substrate-binding protein